MADANSLIMGSSIPTATFPRAEKGTTHEGTITALDVAQARVYQKNELAFWPDGQPKMQAIITT